MCYGGPQRADGGVKGACRVVGDDSAATSSRFQRLLGDLRRGHRHLSADIAQRGINRGQQRSRVEVAEMDSTGVIRPHVHLQRDHGSHCRIPLEQHLAPRGTSHEERMGTPQGGGCTQKGQASGFQCRTLVDVTDNGHARAAHILPQDTAGGVKGPGRVMHDEAELGGRRWRAGAMGIRGGNRWRTGHKLGGADCVGAFGATR